MRTSQTRLLGSAPLRLAIRAPRRLVTLRQAQGFGSPTPLVRSARRASPGGRLDVLWLAASPAQVWVSRSTLPSFFEYFSERHPLFDSPRVKPRARKHSLRR